MRLSRLQIERELRRRIQARIYPPGSCLPSRRALQQELGGSPLTIQAAFDQLVQQGYAVPHGTQGTYVAEHLPNESTVALVFNDGYETGTWNRFYSALSRIAADPVRVHGPSAATTAFRSYCLIGGRPEGEAYERLCADLADGALAGMLFTNPPLLAASSPVLTAPVPRVCIDNLAPGGQPFTTSHLRICDQPVLAALFERLRSRGRARIAGLAGDAGNLERYRTLAAAHGLEARPEWWQWVPTDVGGAGACRRILHLLGTLPPRHRPDCLLISDDNLVPQATSGILDAGWQAPREVEIAAHANFPLVTHAVVPCLRYGLDAADVLRAAAAEIARLAAGGAQRVVEVPFTVPGVDLLESH